MVTSRCDRICPVHDGLSASVSEPTRRSRPGGSARGRARLVDVARLAGVAPITVSRALRDPDKVASGTRERIEAAIQQANYVPDMVASSLASQRSGVVAVVVPTLANSIFSDTVQGLADCLREHSYQPIIGNSGYNVASEEEVVAALLGRRPDGLILTGTNHSARTHKLVEGAEIPVVETWELSRRPIDSVVGFSNRAAGQAMTRALVETGYRRVAFIGPGRYDSRTAHRRDGYVAALRAHGLSPPRTRTTTDAHTIRAGADAFLGLLEEHPDTEAVFCSRDRKSVV